MAFLWIVEFEEMATDINGYPVAVGVEPAIAEEALAIAGSPASSAAFASRTKFVELHCDVDCHIQFGSAPTASKTTGGTRLLAAGESLFRGVKSGLKVSVIDDT